ncbi:hypothetical protein TNCV_987191 [Trichonephila clavipes]|nr:hypothetical protein TNCV_987191 [Trichonephila clavipes]
MGTRYTPDFTVYVLRTRGHGTTPLRVKEDIEDFSSELGNGD